MTTRLRINKHETLVMHYTTTWMLANHSLREQQNLVQHRDTSLRTTLHYAYITEYLQKLNHLAYINNFGIYIL